MAKLVWDQIGEHFYETGVRQVVLYPMTGNAYDTGVAWNGVTSIEESPSGADFNPIYADDIKYLNIQGAEEFGASINAYTYPDEFAECDGEATPISGLSIGQQPRKGFGLCYRTTIGNDTEGINYGYKLHLVYGAQVTPSSKSYSTINDSPEPAEMSWEMNTTPVSVTGMKPTSIIKIDSRRFGAAAMEAIEDILYGSTNSTPRLPLPDEVISIMGAGVYEIVLNKANATVTVGNTVTLTATVTPPGTEVSWESSATGTATVADGVVTGVSAGTATITATITDGVNDYFDICNITVKAAPSA